ncbi:MAG: hypothetical protein ISR65_04275 [Bacteriovoracaceae bacterium]|nr:hypothetical protein [Bacteriovoracaceae bacterium]
MGLYYVDIFTPVSIVAKGLRAYSITIPTVSGPINILPGHTHIIEKLDDGIVIIQCQKRDYYFELNTGICKVRDDRVVILTDKCEESLRK